MSLIDKIKPDFWDESFPTEDSDVRLFDYARLWKYGVIGAFSISLLPLIIMFVLNHYENKRTLEGKMMRPIYCYVTDIQQSISSFIAHRRMALDYIAEDNSFDELADRYRLDQVFTHLKSAFGEFLDLGVFDSKGIGRAYAGPDHLGGPNTSDHSWFRETNAKGFYVSEMQKGIKGDRYFIISIKHGQEGRKPFFLKAAFNGKTLENLILSKETINPSFDAFLVNKNEVLQTDSRFYGRVFQKSRLPDHSQSGKHLFQELVDESGRSISLIAVPIAGTPFISMTVAPRDALSSGLFSLSGSFMGFIVLTILCILVIVLVLVTYLIGRVYSADRRRVAILHNLQYTNKMATIGRLAAGVAHEINNPLAIISEKAGLLKDLINFKQEIPHDRCLEIVDSIQSSVSRCGAITHSLLGFARHIDVRFETIRLEEVIKGILLFFGKESEYRRISVNVSVSENLSPIESDVGQVEQVFLNVINNAFAAVEDGGRIDIDLFPQESDMVGVRIEDDGCGISEENLTHIYDPFFSTKGERGSGLGLSITYGIVKKLGGMIDVKSERDRGSAFTVTLPIERENPDSIPEEPAGESFAR
ncbi:MAG: two-component sensor histidine kinase [Deltaproteobacteria bacterium]|nr:two-component sensor histidine kinase [Deltaproteobacteria bacterium]